MVLWEYKELATGANGHKTTSSAESSPNLQNKLGEGEKGSSRAGRAAAPKAERSLQGQKVPQGPHRAGTAKQSL